MANQQDRKTPGRNSNAKRNRAIAAGMAAASTIGGLAAAARNPAQGPHEQAGVAPVALNETAPEGSFVPRTEWDIKQTRNEQVDFFIEFLMFRNRDKTKLWLERQGKYGPMISQKLAERGMPQDLLWLATIESGMNPNAYSKADAAGLWQFIEETGERHGLEVSTYVDERRDPIKSTDAALDYLKKLNDRFKGSWYLSAAAYNTGENRVERIARERAGGNMSEEAYWQISKHLPRETRDYVPIMLAMAYIGKDPAKYGFSDIQRQEPLRFNEMRVPAGTRLADLAAQLGVAPDELYDLNPHLVKKMTPPDREWSVRVPVTSSGLAAGENQVEPKGE